MKINAETKYCQTCGIPLDIDYTNLEANQNVEYCDYCLHNGVKLYDFSMDYLIYLWELFPEEYYKETGVNLTSERKNSIRIEPSIEKISGIRIAYLKLERTNNVIHSFSVLWKQLLQFSEKYELSSKGCKYVSFHELNKVYRHIYLDWLPTSDYTLREQLTFESYINTLEKTPVSELITDIYIPITKKEI
ncbi:GyrI-like domain-containing protein [Bacteroides congonensis]|jgi:hypothetical protein|uniref:GyrI-like domain-containing protein n=1 Tax=Bacteroides congonensis TaxID=1871006 RepID=UPI0009334F97|nr:GyrI-like domain-containing protein [Bacteroides congonensis]